jgi:putative peptide zinc metalloprotease protein
MAHTTLYLKTLWGRLMGNAHGEIANLDIPARELSVVRVYAWFWLLGQIVAIWAFFFISIPITFRYIEAGIAVLQSPASAGLSTVIDTLGSYVLVLFPWFAGVYMWTRQLTQRRLWLAQSS